LEYEGPIIGDGLLEYWSDGDPVLHHSNVLITSP